MVGHTGYRNGTTSRPRSTRGCVADVVVCILVVGGWGAMVGPFLSLSREDIVQRKVPTVEAVQHACDDRLGHAMLIALRQHRRIPRPRGVGLPDDDLVLVFDACGETCIRVSAGDMGGGLF